MTMKTNDGRNVKMGFNLKRKFKKFFGIAKEFQTNDGEKKDETERTTYEKGLQFDAVPDNHREKEASYSSDEADPDSDKGNLEDLPNKPKEKFSTDEKPFPEKDNFTNGFKSHFSWEDGREEKPSRTRTNVVKNETNIVVSGGSGIHIGNVFTTVNNIQSPNNQKAKQDVRIEKTEAIKDLIKSKKTIKPGHLQLLSEHLGREWKEVGKCIGLTTGETDMIEDKYKTCDEKAFQMLSKWWQQLGESATLGALCKKLWQTQIQTAREAVQQLSLSKVD